MAASSHAKYDKTKTAHCPLCNVADTQSHWLTCPRFAAIRADIPAWPYGHEFDDELLLLVTCFHHASLLPFTSNTCFFASPVSWINLSRF